MRIPRVITLLGALALACSFLGCDLANSASSSCACSSGSVDNSFADGSHYCCPGSYPYYCSGDSKCYQTWEDAYYGNTCTLPQDRETCGGGSSSGGGGCSPNCASGTHQVGCSCVQD